MLTILSQKYFVHEKKRENIETVYSLQSRLIRNTIKFCYKIWKYWNITEILQLI